MYATAERPDLAIALGERLLRRAPEDTRLRAWYVASLDQSRRFEELRAAARLCSVPPADPWAKIECAYGISSRARGWRMGLNSADKYVRAAAQQRPADPEVALLASRLLARRAAFVTHQYAPVVAFMDSAVYRTAGDYDVRAWRAAVRFDAAGVAPVDTGAQTAALRELGELRREQSNRIPAYHAAAERLMSNSAGEALLLLKAAMALQPGSVELRTDYWRALLGRSAVAQDERRASIVADIASWIPAMDSSTTALAAASNQLRSITHDSLARVLDDRLLARAPVSREADDVLWRRAREWSDSLRHTGDSTSVRPALDSARLRDVRLRAFDDLVFHHKFTSQTTRAYAAASLLDYVRADSSYPHSKLLAVARLVHAAQGPQAYQTHAVTAVALAERKVALREAEQWTREGQQLVWREVDDMASLYPTSGERAAALERWQTVFVVARAVVQGAAGRYATADSTLDLALMLTPGNAFALYETGRLRLLQHRQTDAEMAFARALGGRDPLGRNQSKRYLERLYVDHHGSLAGWDAYLADLNRRERDGRRDRLLASALSNVPTPPPIALNALDGHLVTSDSLKGKIALVNFWGTWCGPCVAEMPALQELYDKYRADTTVMIVTIAKEEKLDALKAWMATKHYTMPTLFDEGYSARASIPAWPTTWVLDRDGSLRYRLTSTPAQLVEEWSWVIESMRAALPSAKPLPDARLQTVLPPA
ncbi:MAG: TlpA family protein disulfide reductase [Gemmatimonadaceae bacterium]